MRTFARKYRSLLMFSVIAFLTAGFGFDCPAELPSSEGSFDRRFYDNGAVRSGSERGQVRAIAVDTRTGNIFAGGVFIRMDGTAAYSIVVYDVTLDRWKALAGLGLTTNGTGEAEVKALAISGKYLYVSGFFRGTVSGVMGLNNIARYDIDEGIWSPLTDGGVSGSVNSLAVVGNDLYVGGNFNSTYGGGTVNLNNIARYNTATSVWSGFANGGVNNFVSDFAFFGNELFVSGGFSQTFDNAIGLKHIARYDLINNSWAPLGNDGTNNIVYNLVISAGSLYAGGIFTATGDFSMPLNRIARYDIAAATWSPLANNPLNGRVNALEFSGETLYVGGEFDVFDGLSHIARYNTATETWSAFSGGGLISGDVYAFAVSDNQLFVGGSFFGPYGSAGDNYIHPGFARYSLVPVGGVSEANGLPANSWLPVGLSNGKALNGDIVAVAVDTNGIVYVGGSFTGTAAGSVTNLNRIARYNPATDTWSALANGGVNGFAGVNALAIHNGILYVGGSFTTTFDGAVTNLNRIARYNLTTNSWSPLAENGVNGFGVYSLAVHGDNLYAGGDFTQTSNGAVTNLNRVARYNTTTNTWSSLAGNGLNGFVTGLAVQGDNLYFGGDFTQTSDGATNLNYIARYDTTNNSWSSLANNGMNARVIKIHTFDNSLYLRGNFSSTFDNALTFNNSLARYNTANNSWSAISGNAESVAAVQNTSAAVRSGNDLFVGGGFTLLNNAVARSFTRIYLQQWNVPSVSADWFDGSNWTTGVFPAFNTNAVIPTGAGQININSADVTLDDLMLGGGTLTVGAGRTLTINGILALNGGNINGDGTVIIATCKPEGILNGGETSYIQTALVQCVNDSGTFNFPVGTANGYSPITIKNITGTGNILIKANQGAFSGAANNLPANRLARWWQIENPGGGVTNANLFFGYNQSDINGDESNYRAYRISSGMATAMTGSVNTFSNRVLAENIMGFSDWTLAELAPLSAQVSIGGRVASPTGQGISKTIVSLTKPNGEVLSTQTNAFGFYRFDNLEAGAIYTISVRNKRFVFNPDTMVITPSENVENADFIASP